MSSCSEMYLILFYGGAVNALLQLDEFLMNRAPCPTGDAGLTAGLLGGIVHTEFDILPTMSNGRYPTA